MPTPYISNPYQALFTLYSGNAVRLEIDWYPNGLRRECDIVAVVSDEELLIFVDGVRVASVVGANDLLRYSRLSQQP